MSLTSAPPPAALPGAAPSAHRPPQPGPGIALAAADGGSLQLPAQHFAAAVLFLAAAAAGLLVVAPELAAGAFLAPRVAGITHLFTLGWLTTTSFGALYQLLPVALGASVRWPWMGHVSFWSYVPGAALFAGGVFASSTMLHHAGIALLATGILALLANVGASLPRARARDATWWAVVLALLALLSTIVLGVVLLHNMHTGFPHEHRVRTLAAHLHVALVGWTLVLIVGMSHRLLPMFLLAHGVGARWAIRALTLLPLGLVALAAGLLSSHSTVSWTGAILLELGVASFLWQCHLYYVARKRPALDVGLRFVGTALGFLAASALLAPIVLAVGGVQQPRLATAYVVLGLLGGIVLYTVGHFYKIVPFLAWITRFRGRVGRERVPTVSDLYSARVAHVQLACMIAGVAGLAAGTLLGSVALARAAAALFAAGVTMFAIQIVRVARCGSA